MSEKIYVVTRLQVGSQDAGSRVNFTAEAYVIGAFLSEDAAGLAVLQDKARALENGRNRDNTVWTVADVVPR